MDSQPTMRYLQEARNVALNDPSSYTKIVPILLPIINPNAPLDQRRWGADFLAEMFASPIFATDEKQQLAVEDRTPSVLDTLAGYLDKPSEDTGVIKSAVQAAASIYPLVFRQM
jgi:symplekin